MSQTEEKNVIANPLIVLREEFDDWAILFDPDTGNTFSLNPIGVLIWKQLDGHHSLDDIVTIIKEAAADVPSAVTGHVQAFVKNAAGFGLVRCEEHRG
ncbi:MAG: SynChlorMet cassette protein ScmD [Deltaproteobacteria bacterium]|nr:SynChlorMet cassette protein ScmD [Deltaproteobacteria bacterium]